MSEPIIVRFLTRQQARKPHVLRRSIKVEDPEAGDYRRFSVRWARKSRDTGKRMTLPGFGTSRITVDAGPDKGKLDIRIDGDQTSVFTHGWAVDEKLKRMRPDDHATLQEMDARELALHRELVALRERRLNFLHEAFQRGHRVTVKELVELADAEAAR